jgi:LCP family protein required for cell wall assembly
VTQPVGAASDVVPHRPRRRGRRVLRWVAGSLAVLLVATATGLVVAYRYYGSLVDEVPGLEGLDEAPAGEVDRRGENFLLVGSDTSDSLTDAELAQIGLTREERDGIRTDTIILVHVPRDGGSATFVSFPRDSFVSIPGHPDNKLNSAYEAGELERPGGGPAKLVATIELLTDLDVHHYVEVDLLGLHDVTNALDGVEVCLSEPAREPKSGIDLSAGRHVLDGRQALAFVRQRDEVPGADLGRIRRQQHFLASVVREALSTGVLLDPRKLDRLLRAVGDSLRTDPGTSTKDLIDAARSLRGVVAGQVQFQTVPVADGDARRDVPGNDDASVVLLDEAALPGFFAPLREQAPSTAPSVPVPSAPTPSGPVSPAPAPTAAPSPSPSPSVSPPTTAADDGCVR